MIVVFIVDFRLLEFYGDGVREEVCLKIFWFFGYVCFF